MGNKIHPNSVRLGYIHDWESKWFSLRDMPALIGEDFKIRNLVKNTFKMAAVSWVGIERAGKRKVCHLTVVVSDEPKGKKS